MSIIDSEAAPGDWDYRAIRSVPFARVETELLALYLPPQRSKSNHSRMRLVFRLVGELLGPDGSTADINPSLVARFIASRPKGEATRTTHSLLAVFRVICNYALSQGYIRSSPWEFRKKWVRLGEPIGVKHHSRENIKAVLDLLATEVSEADGWEKWRRMRLQAMVSLFAYTGLRKMEGLTLHVADVDLENRMIYLVERNGRTLKTEKSAQPIPIADELATILEEWLRWVDAKQAGHPSDSPACPFLFPGVSMQGPWVNGCQGYKPLDELRAAGERAGVHDFTFQSLRHSFATHSESWGLSPAMIQRVLRHTNLSTQHHYRHADPMNMRAAVKRITFNPQDGGTES